MRNKATVQQNEDVFDRLHQHQQAISVAEHTLHEQCQELERVLNDLKNKYQNTHGHCMAELEVLRMGNDCLQQLVAERDQQLGELTQRLAATAQRDPQAQTNLADVHALHEQLKEKEVLIEELRASRQETAPQTADPHAPKQLAEVHALREQLKEKESLIQELRAAREEMPAHALAGVDDRDYEAELTEFRRQLETDRQELNEEIQQLRARNAELNDAAREAELELSRERAQLARERAQLDRMREEIRQEAERAQRDAGVRERLVAVDRLKEEVAEKHRPLDPAAPVPSGSTLARWRSLLSG